ncbi:vanadium-dependent haloperoxidase [Algoriphagus halophytocola]|uniref:Vanadium-dependent haloperoxidase n=1 Tax=Algoriphagus halophytocola TaxID=2991499 RepID=A0ABY6ME83_9BACT|nr:MULTISPECIES: vanadium-dependent haloperoxidase [unclassified Algoriphagus]UZD22100.1 vanadium-dependent haloperoxidase [Algoriphagus sp. TR-M5]WBL43351.1 vanadium-dependent haloperoxidase [Algoriphagus sp. TR-M9]
MRLKKLLLFSGIILLAVSCAKKVDYTHTITDGHYLSEAQDKITEVIIHDIFSPPVAARIYSYASLAAYEVAAATDPSYVSLLGQLNGSEKVEFSPSDKVYPPLASLAAYYHVGTGLIFSEDLMHQHRDSTYAVLQEKGIPDDVMEASIAFGQEVGDVIKAYSSKDNYHQSRSFPKFTVTGEEGTWEPTPPAYMEAIEPHWNKIRTFVLDSASQFKPLPPPPFSTDPDSEFFKVAKEVYDIDKMATQEQKDIALFWDCNPYKMNVKGHVMFAEKKITPGGHWMSIAAIASKAAQKDWKGTAEALAMTSISLNEAFISCWDEKYRSNLIRPETYINQHIDETWVPILQTPPFPEHTSGHSVASAASAYTLAQLFGDEFHIVDSSEVAYGLPIREFDSFSQAAEEAALSRFYGGIHYRPAIEYGITEGRDLAEFIWSKVDTKAKNIASN